MKRAAFCAIALVTFATEAQQLEQSFQQEYVYLTSQKESLTRQKTEMEAAMVARLRKTQAQVSEMQRRLTRLMATNDEKHEELLVLEKQKKELQKRGTSLESTYKKAIDTLADFERQLRFENPKDKQKAPASVPENITLADLGPTFAKADLLLRSSARPETFTGYFLDGEDALKKGEVTRLGRVAAFLQKDGKKMILGPSGTGTLKFLEEAHGQQTFIFDNLNEEARIQKAATIVERLADIGPIFFLGLMLLMVTGLFLVLVRI